MSIGLSKLKNKKKKKYNLKLKKRNLVCNLTPLDQEHGMKKAILVQENGGRKTPKNKNKKNKNLDSKSNYKQIRKLGEGASGKVWEVRRKGTEDLFAMKIMALSSEKDKNRALNAELSTLKKCDSPYIINLDNYFKQGFFVYLILELMDCGSLRDIINKVIEQDGKFPESVIAEIAHQSLLGLKYLHEERGVMHRDIKPANVLLKESGEVKLADLGMAGKKKIINRTYVGTMIYMSPERFLGEPHFVNCDIWSLGLTLAECALLNFPFTVDIGNPWGVFEILEKFRNERSLLDKRNYSENFIEFIDKTLTVSKEERPHAKDLLEHPFLKENLGKEPKLSDFLKEVKKKAKEMKKKKNEQGGGESEASSNPLEGDKDMAEDIQ